MKDTQKSATSAAAIDRPSARFTDEERSAMWERAQELTSADEARIGTLVKTAAS